MPTRVSRSDSTLAPGDVLVIDPMANVIGLNREASGRVRRVTLATGRFDARASARTLLVEMKSDGRISVGRWARPG